jgi:hypothetical protein
VQRRTGRLERASEKSRSRDEGKERSEGGIEEVSANLDRAKKAPAFSCSITPARQRRGSRATTGRVSSATTKRRKAKTSDFLFIFPSLSTSAPSSLRMLNELRWTPLSPHYCQRRLVRYLLLPKRIEEPGNELFPLDLDVVTRTLLLPDLRLDTDGALRQLSWRDLDGVRDALLVDDFELLGEFRLRLVHKLSLKRTEQSQYNQRRARKGNAP